jgi:hypothetical protein
MTRNQGMAMKIIATYLLDSLYNAGLGDIVDTTDLEELDIEQLQSAHSEMLEKLRAIARGND